MSKFYAGTQTPKLINNGPLGPFIGDYATLLERQGYSQSSGYTHILLLKDFNRWMNQEGLAACQVSQPIIDRYFRLRYQRRRPWHEDRPALNRFMALLREKGVVCDPIPTISYTPIQQIEEDFKRYLAQERGLSLASQKNNLKFVSKFLCEYIGPGSLDFTHLCAEDVIKFVQRHAPHISTRSACQMVISLRNFLRYLQLKGEITIDLAGCVPKIANWRLSTLPRYIQPHQVQQVLDCCDHHTVQGKRNYAILLLLARLGLRAGEIVSLTLDDINWDAGELTVKGKGPHRAKLPLPHDVGEALAIYLTQARPHCPSRRVFISLKAPLHGFVNSNAIATLVARALKKAGVESQCTGAHLLRHSLATQLLRQGASMEEISQLLRHRNFNSTVIYAKVDLMALRPLAQPWPGGDL